jgi:Asp-tRNA(Asn)/Glu-tRNA(Gln) amidotransferase A subunit family amidase
LLTRALSRYTRQAETIFSPGPKGIDVLVVPSAPTHWTVSEVLADPIATNSVLGTFTHFGNVLDLNGISVPAGTYATENRAEQETEKSEKASVTLPFGVTFLGSSRTDATVLEIARRFSMAVKK